MNTKSLSIIAKNGLWFGIALCLYSIFMWLTKLDMEYLYIGQYLDMLVVIVPIYFIIKAIREYARIEPITIWQRLLIAVGVGFIGYVVQAPYLYFYHNVINPDWFDAVVALEKKNMLVKNISSEEIQIKTQAMIIKNQAQNKLFNMSAFIPSVLILPLLISLLSFIFIKKPQKLV